MTNNILGERIRDMRESKRLSQLQLADQLDISRLSIGNYEKGDRTPDSLLLKQMAILFSCSTDYLLGLSDTKRPENTILMESFGLSDESILAMQKMFEAKEVFPNIGGELMPFFNELIVKKDFICFIKHLQICGKYFNHISHPNNDCNLVIDYPAYLGGVKSILTEDLLVNIEKIRMHDYVDSLLTSMWGSYIGDPPEDLMYESLP